MPKYQLISVRKGAPDTNGLKPQNGAKRKSVYILCDVL